MTGVLGRAAQNNNLPQGVRTRDTASALRGYKVYVLEEESVDLEEDEYMVRDIVGAHAYQADDERTYLGEVVGVLLGDDISSAVGLASDMLELQLPNEMHSEVEKVCYVPFVPDYVPTVRLSNDSRLESRVLLNLPEGFLDLAVEVREKATIRGFLPE